MAVVSLPVVVAKAPISSVAVPVPSSNADPGSVAASDVVAGCSGNGSCGGDPL